MKQILIMSFLALAALLMTNCSHYRTNKHKHNGHDYYSCGEGCTEHSCRGEANCTHKKDGKACPNKKEGKVCKYDGKHACKHKCKRGCKHKGKMSADTDGDGHISKKEWDEKFTKMDTNKDGKVSREEKHAYKRSKWKDEEKK